MRFTKMSGQHKSENFLVSDSLKDLVDEDSFVAKPPRKNRSSKDASILFDEVMLNDASASKDLFFPLFAWTKVSVTIVSPPSHLSKFFNPVDDKTTFTLFGKTQNIMSTTAVKKDGEWYVTLFTEQDI